MHCTELLHTLYVLILSLFMSCTVIYICRRVKSDVDLQIPPKKEVLVYCPLTTRQKEIYKVGYIYGLQPVRKYLLSLCKLVYVDF